MRNMSSLTVMSTEVALAKKTPTKKGVTLTVERRRFVSLRVRSVPRGKWQCDIYTCNPGKTLQRSDVYNKEKGLHIISSQVLNLHVLKWKLVPTGAGFRAATFLPRRPAGQRRGQAYAAQFRLLFE